MSEIDWSKAPEGAQGYMPQDNLWIAGWWKEESGSRYFWNQAEGVQGEWKRSFANPFDRPEFIPCPSPSWNGEGLPPVGAVCERALSHTARKVTTICGHSTDGAYASFYDGDGLMGWGDDCKFFPLRTPEQIAAVEREAAIDSMVQFFMNYYGNPKGAEQYLLLCRSLHDAGYRKQADR